MQLLVEERYRSHGGDVCLTDIGEDVGALETPCVRDTTSAVDRKQKAGGALEAVMHGEHGEKGIIRPQRKQLTAASHVGHDVPLTEHDALTVSGGP